MAARARILVVIKGLGVGGAETLVSEAARFWDRSRFEYRVAYQLPWKDQLVVSLEMAGIPVECFGATGGGSVFTALALRQSIRASGAQIVHAHLPAAGVMSRLVSNVPVVYTEHNLATSYRQPTRTLNRLTYGRNRAVTTVSDAVAASLSGYPGPSPQVVPNGVSVNVTPEDSSRARAELGLGASDPLVAHVGNIRPHKGHNTLIEAAAELCRARSGVTIVSIGGEKHPGDLDRVRSAAREAGIDHALKFLGRRTDALSFVAAADVFVNPSDVEGLPVAILEAMALGTPVVATAVGGVPALIEDGETGLLVFPGDSAGLAGAVGRLLTDRGLAGDLSKAGRSLVEREYGLERMVAAFEDIYTEILSG